MTGPKYLADFGLDCPDPEWLDGFDPDTLEALESFEPERCEPPDPERRDTFEPDLRELPERDPLFERDLKRRQVSGILMEVQLNAKLSLLP